MDLSNTCYYTFSTIAQTLAGAFGFLVAVVLYRIQSLEQLIPNIAETIQEDLLDQNRDIRNSCLRREWEALLSHLKSKVWRNECVGSVLESQERIKRGLISKIDELRGIRTLLHVTLWVTGTVIGNSLLLIILTPFICSLAVTAYPFLIVDVMTAIACLVLFGLLTYRAVRD